MNAAKRNKDVKENVDSFVIVDGMKLNTSTEAMEIPGPRKILFETTYSNMKECGKKGSG